MTNIKNTKRALISSVLSLFLCFAMLLGTTFAWFTDTVSSEGNVIQTGKLKVAFEWADGATDPANTTWTDASEGAIFDYANWEPGYTEARHLKVTNVGTLALNYQMRIVANGVVSDLADVIDVYYFDEDKALTRGDLANAEHLGTLTEVLGTEKHLSNTIKGSLKAGDPSDIHTLVLKMQETAGNEYQDMDLGCTFSVQLIASQMTAEKDSFDDQYDAPAPNPSFPAALVRELDNKNITYTEGIGGAEFDGVLDAAYQFEPTMSYDEFIHNSVLTSAYQLWHADYVVYADTDVPANSMMLAGYYSLWCENFNQSRWVGLSSSEDITAGTEIRLVDAMGGNAMTVNWENLCEYGNDKIGFLCGATDLTGVNAGTTITVELRIYEVGAQGDCAEGGGCKHPYASCETGNYMTVGYFTYTFGTKESTDSSIAIVHNAAELQAAVNGAVAGQTTFINFANDITGNVTVTQLAGANVVINGCGNEYTGVMTVFGNGNQAGTETLTIKNVNFVAADGANSCIYSPDRSENNKYSYSHNVSVQNCTFTDPQNDLDCAAIRHGDGGDANWTVTNCTVESSMHSLLQINNVAGEGITLNGCKVYSKNGVNLNQCVLVTINNCEFDVTGYAVRFGAGSGSVAAVEYCTITNSTLKSACDDGDAVIIFRGTGVNTVLTLVDTTLEGTLKVTGNTTEINGTY